MDEIIVLDDCIFFFLGKIRFTAFAGCLDLLFRGFLDGGSFNTAFLLRPFIIFLTSFLCTFMHIDISRLPTFLGVVSGFFEISIIELVYSYEGSDGNGFNAKLQPKLKVLGGLKIRGTKYLMSSRRERYIK